MNKHQAASKKALLRLVYLLSVAISLFFINYAPALLAILFFQLILWQSSNLKWSLMTRSMKRLGILFVIIFLSYAFIDSASPATDKWTEFNEIPVNLSNVLFAGVMCLRVFTLVLISLWIQNVSKEGEFVASLRTLGMPYFISVALDVSLILLSSNRKRGSSGKGGGDGQGKRQKSEKSSTPVVFKQLLRGDLSFLYRIIEKALSNTQNYITQNYPEISEREARDIAIIAGMTVAMMGLKFIQLMPGLPVAPGHKNLLMLPMFLLASQLTHCRFGGLWTGLTLGIVNFLFGFGKFGVLEILQFVIPGLLADLLLPMTQGARSRWARTGLFAVIGGILGFGRFSANIGILILAGTPLIAVLALLPMLLSQIIFGILSGIVSAYILGRSFSTSSEELSPAEQEKHVRKSET